MRGSRWRLRTSMRPGSAEEQFLTVGGFWAASGFFSLTGSGV
jgi:hypothetical protein